MTGKGTRKSVDTGYSSDRLERAKEFRATAHLVMNYAPPDQAGNAVILNVVEAAIAYADTLSAAYGAKSLRRSEAESLIGTLDRFADWAEEILADRKS